jgi:phasin family protein
MVMPPMNEEMMMPNNVFVPYQTLPAAMVKANRLAVAQLERLVSFQQAALQGYVDLGLNRLKAAAEVAEPKDLQAFYAGQAEVAKTVGQKWADDAGGFAELLADFKVEFVRLVQDSAAEIAPQTAKPVARQAA